MQKEIFLSHFSFQKEDSKDARIYQLEQKIKPSSWKVIKNAPYVLEEAVMPQIQLPTEIIIPPRCSTW